MGSTSLKIILFFALILFNSCGGQGPIGTYDPSGGGGVGGSAPLPGSGGGNDSGQTFDGNPATRPTPGFAEMALAPATSTSEPTSANPNKALLLNNGIVTIHEVRMHLKELSLIDENQQEVLRRNGPFIVRLLEDQVIVDEAFPLFGGGVIPKGDYHEMQFRFAKLDDPALIPAELLEDLLTMDLLPQHSIVVTGSIKLLNKLLPGFLTIPFQFFSSEEDVIRIMSPNPIVAEEEFFHLFIAFKVQQWFDNDVITLLGLLDPLAILQTLILEVGSSVPLLDQIAKKIELNIHQSIRFAPSLDDQFEESDVDEESSSLSL